MSSNWSQGKKRNIYYFICWNSFLEMHMTYFIIKYNLYLKINLTSKTWTSQLYYIYSIKKERTEKEKKRTEKERKEQKKKEKLMFYWSWISG